MVKAITKNTDISSLLILLLWFLISLEIVPSSKKKKKVVKASRNPDFWSRLYHYQSQHFLASIYSSVEEGHLTI